MQANTFLEFFPFSGKPLFEAAILAYEPEAENFRDAPNSIFDPQGKSLICTKFQAFSRLAQFLHVSLVL